MYWIVLANTNLCRIYLYERETHQLSLLREESHPESKSKSSDLASDRPGRYSTSGKAHGTYSSHTDPKDDEIDHFLKMLADEFEAGRVANQYEKLILIAPARVNGILSKHLNKNVARLIIDNVKKDYTHLAPHELTKFVHENWKELSSS